MHIAEAGDPPRQVLFHPLPLGSPAPPSRVNLGFPSTADNRSNTVIGTPGPRVQPDHKRRRHRNNSSHSSPRDCAVEDSSMHCAPHVSLSPKKTTTGHRIPRNHLPNTSIRCTTLSGTNTNRKSVEHSTISANTRLGNTYWRRSVPIDCVLTSPSSIASELRQAPR